MPLGTFIAGRYSSTLNSNSLGITQDGYEIQFEPREQVINRSDAFGDMMIDTVYRGGDWFCQWEAMEAFLTGTQAAMHPFGALGTVGLIGRLGSDIATALVLTATAATPAAASPATLTATKSKLASNSQPRMPFNSMLRTIPIRHQWYPYDSGAGVIKHFTST